LPIYNPDILLIHLGTNGGAWQKKASYYTIMLNWINDYAVANNNPLTVFVCQIINRFRGGHALTTQFNTELADTIATRTGDLIKIIMVDMENGAGFDYSDAPPDLSANPPYAGGDMWGETYPGVANDEYHPNDRGNTKMAVKFFEELVEELGAPTNVERPGTNQLPQQLELFMNYPNPFNPSTTIKFEIPESGKVKLSVYNIVGQEVAELINDYRIPGTYSILFKGSNLASGVYFYKLQSNGYHITKRMLLIN
jgi:hypothetical protein